MGLTRSQYGFDEALQFCGQCRASYTLVSSLFIHAVLNMFTILLLEDINLLSHASSAHSHAAPCCPISVPLPLHNMLWDV